MMSTKKRLVRAAKAGSLCALALILQGNASAADSSVPLLWNVAPMRSGAYLEAFESMPAWATNSLVFNVLSNDFPAMTGLPMRSNVWFDANTKVLQLETAGEVVTNTLLHSDTSAVNFSANPVYVDLRIKFDPLTSVLDPAMLSNVKMALFVSSDAHLAVVHAGGVSTNAVTLDTDKWYQVTVKLLNGKFDVLMNDVLVFSGLSIKEGVGAENTLSSANFYGTGLIDALYVSHGDPAYAVTGPTIAVPDLPAPGSLADEELTRVNAWLSVGGVTALTGLSQAQINTAYLLDSLSGNAVDPVESYTFGISKIKMTSPTQLEVTVSLTVDAVAKSGKVNGRIQLQGKVALGDSWTVLGSAITPSFAEFTNGSATYTFNIPAEGGYTFFQPLIVP